MSAYPTGDAVGATCVDVPASEWLAALTAAKDAGGRLDWLGAVDLAGRTSERDDASEGEIEVVAGVREGAQVRLWRTRVAAGTELASLSALFPGASWHEREATEMLGVRFTGGDSRPLLLAHSTPATQGSPPLRKGYPLAPRLAKPWPGAAGSRRRSRIPGNNPAWTEASE